MGKVSSGEDGIIDLKGEEEFGIDNSFSISHIENEEKVHVSEVKNQYSSELQASTKVKVTFERFVNLIASHDYESVFKKELDKEVIISADLLAELANAHTEKEEIEEKKFPYLFIAGLILGVVVTWFLLK